MPGVLNMQYDNVNNIIVTNVIRILVCSICTSRRSATNDFIFFKGMLRPIFCIDINTYSDKKWKIV